MLCLSEHFRRVYPSADFETSLSTDGDGGEGGEEENAGTQRAGETPGRREGETAGTERGQSAVLSSVFAVHVVLILIDVLLKKHFANLKMCAKICKRFHSCVNTYTKDV